MTLVVKDARCLLIKVGLADVVVHKRVEVLTQGTGALSNLGQLTLWHKKLFRVFAPHPPASVGNVVVLVFTQRSVEQLVQLVGIAIVARTLGSVVSQTITFHDTVLHGRWLCIKPGSDGLTFWRQRFENRTFLGRLSVLQRNGGARLVCLATRQVCHHLVVHVYLIIFILGHLIVGNKGVLPCIETPQGLGYVIRDNLTLIISTNDLCGLDSTVGVALRPLHPG